MTSKNTGKSIITAKSQDGTQAYVQITGPFDHEYGPDPEQYHATPDRTLAKKFPNATGKIDINIIDAKRFLPGYAWEKQSADKA